jgi:hypothetical protein
MAHRITHDDTRKITRDDLEAKFQGLQNDLQGRVEEKKRTVLGTAAGVGVVLLLLVFLLGRRSGKKKNTMVEIRRY